MRVIVGDELKRFVETNVQNYIDIDVQVQQVGMDLTLRSVMQVMSRSRLDVDKNTTELPTYRVLEPSTSVTNDRKPHYVLDPCETYIFKSNEIFKIPTNMFALIYPRSTLTRMGIILVSAVVDPGYEGYLTFAVRTTTNVLIEPNARFAQIIFYELDEHAPKYNGSYQKSGIEGEFYELHERRYKND